MYFVVLAHREIRQLLTKFFPTLYIPSRDENQSAYRRCKIALGSHANISTRLVCRIYAISKNCNGLHI